MCRVLSVIAIAVLFTDPALGGWGEGWDAYKRRDYATAASEFMALAEQGDARAQVALQVMQVFDEDGPRSSKKLANWRNTPDERNLKEAEQWFRNAAKKGDAKAWTLLGHMYNDLVVRFYHGEPGPVEITVQGDQMIVKPKKVRGDVIKWWQRAAEKGDVTAQKSLSFVFAIQNDMKKSDSWIRKAAEQGDRWAQKHLGSQERDRVRGCMWRILAAEQYGMNTTEDRPEIACGLSGDQDAKAQELVREWRERHQPGAGFIVSLYPHETESDGTPSCLVGATFGPLAEDSPLFGGAVRLQVISTEPGSIAEDMQLGGGDAVVTVNGHMVHDLDGFTTATKSRSGVVVLKMLRLGGLFYNVIC